jgi:hypothetical protein
MKSILNFRHDIEKYGFKCLEFGNPHPWAKDTAQGAKAWRLQQRPQVRAHQVTEFHCDQYIAHSMLWPSPSLTVASLLLI